MSASGISPDFTTLAHLEQDLEHTQYLSAKHVEVLLKQIAEGFSDLRKIRKFEHMLHLDYLRNMPYSVEEMREDWSDACAFLALMILEGTDISFLQLEPASYHLLEEVWFKTAKQLRAYYQWQKCDQGTPDANYFKATNDLRQTLLGRRPASLAQFERVKNYLQENYLDGSATGKLDESKPRTNMLLRGMAQRIWENTGNIDAAANWFRARTYTHLYYDNIVPAVTEKNAAATASIMKAFQFSKAPTNRYLIINCFEVAVASEFLDKDLVFAILREPDSFAFSMVSVDNWPEDREELGRVGKVRYRSDERLLVCEGLMTTQERDDLFEAMVEPQHRQAIQGLYEQSRLGPLESMVL